ncbi:MAG: 4-hydroxy-tetrahydrodipicolinate synthase [Pseudomonadota bacterium]
MSLHRFEGTFTALVTPFRDGRIDSRALLDLVEEQITAGVDGLVAVGTTGESPTVAPEEYAQVVAMMVGAARGRVPVVAGAGSSSTAHAIEMGHAAKHAKADGLLVVTPYYNKPTQDGLYRHFRAIVDTVGLPTILYNVPGRTGCDLLPATIARLADLELVVGVKEATGQVLRATQIIQEVGDRLAVLSGDDFTAMPLYAVGARGVISVVSNVDPRSMVEMWRSANKGDYARARELHYHLQPLAEAMFCEPNPIPVKCALALMGRIAEELRPPLFPLSGPARERLAALLKARGLS